MTDIGGGGANLSPGSFIRQAIGEGLGVTAARDLYRQSGGAMSNAHFGELFGQIRTAVGGRSAIARLDYDQLPPADVITPWAAGTPDKYAYFVEVHVRDIGARTVTSKWHQVVSSVPLTPNEARDRAIDVVTGGNETGMTPSGEVVIDATVTSITRTVARSA